MTNPDLSPWSPADHYDIAFEILGEIPTIVDQTTTQDGQLAASTAIAHALLGILRRLDQYTP